MKSVRRLAYGDTLLEYTVRAHTRQGAKVRIHVESDATVLVEAPPDATAQAVAAAVRKRARWIHSQVERIRSSRLLRAHRDWVSGESQRYLGRRYMLMVTTDPTMPERTALSGGLLRVNVHARNADRIRNIVLDWYRQRARERFSRRVVELAAHLPWVKETPPMALRVMQSRWGSCSPNGRLTLNPLLVRAPREAVDYVIVHELCHLRHHDHGPAFYRLLGRYVPGWKPVKARLDQSAEGLFAEET